LSEAEETITYRTPVGVHGSWWLIGGFEAAIGCALVAWMGLDDGAVLLAVFVGFIPLRMLRLSFEVVEMQLIQGERSRMRMSTRWRTTERSTSELHSIQVYVGPVSNLAVGDAPVIKGRIYVRFRRGRAKRVPLVRDAGWGPLLSALREQRPALDVFETRWGSLKRWR
jgi:hypothetical protein